VSDPREGHYDETIFPLLKESACLKCIQEVGDAVFVPSGYYHFVENLDELSDTIEYLQLDGPTRLKPNQYTVSVNHNWINAFSAWEVFLFLLRDLSNIRCEISYLREGVPSAGIEKFATFDSGPSQMNETDWLLHCDVLLKANASLNLIDFIGIISARALMIMKYKTSLPDSAFVWGKFFCCWFNPSVTLYGEDRDILQSISESTIDNIELFYTSRRNYLSEFSTSLSFEFKDVLLANNFNASEFPMANSLFSLLVIKNILNCVPLSPNLMCHIETCLEYSQMNIDGCKTDVALSLQPMKDSNCVTSRTYVDALQSFNTCVEQYRQIISA